jgi:hypothetical protein
VVSLSKDQIRNFGITSGLDRAVQHDSGDLEDLTTAFTSS